MYQEHKVYIGDVYKKYEEKSWTECAELCDSIAACEEKFKN